MANRRLIKVVIELCVSLTFIFSVSFTLLHAYGFRYDILERSFVKRTIVDLPGDLTNVYVTFDGNYVSDKAPYQIFNVNPGRHNLKVEKDGYYSWEQNLTAQEDIVSSYPHVYLFPKDMESLKNVILGDVEAKDVTFDKGDVVVVKDDIVNHLNLKTGILEPVTGTNDKTVLETEKALLESKIKLLEPKATLVEVRPLTHPSLHRSFVYLVFADHSKGIYELTEKELVLVDAISLKWSDFTDSGDKLLYSDGSRVKMYDFLEDKMFLLSTFAKPIDFLQWYEDSYFVYGQDGKVVVCDQAMDHCVVLWNDQDAMRKVKKLDYLPADDLWIVVRDKEISTYTFEQ